MIVAGEPSGDAHAAALVNALKEAATNIDFEFFGATGPLMRAAGVDTIINSDSLAIMGILEVGRVLPRFIRAFRTLKAAAIQRSPDAIVLVDWPEFNLRLATSLRRQGFKIVYYISPQLWAWRPRRVNNIKRDVDLLLSILPFEAEWYKERGVEHVEFVGHPLSGEVKAHLTRDQFCERHQLDRTRPIISFLPGSRHKELVRILPPMLDAIAMIYRDRTDVQFVLVVAPSRSLEEAREIVSKHARDERPSFDTHTGPPRNTRCAGRLRCRRRGKWDCDVGSSTAWYSDGNCLQGVSDQLAHARSAYRGGTLRTC